MSRLMTKPTKWHMRPAKTGISLGICPVSSESLLSPWRQLGSLATHWVDSEDWWSDLADAQADLSLCWVHSHFVGFVMRRLKSDFLKHSFFWIVAQCVSSKQNRIWAALWQNQQYEQQCAPNEDSGQPRHLSSLIKSLCCPHEDSLGPQLPTEWTAKTDDQTGRMPRLIWVFAGCSHFVGFVTRRLKSDFLKHSFFWILAQCVSSKQNRIWAALWQNQQYEQQCAPNEDSGQPRHPPSLIRVFAVCSVGSKGPKLSSCGQWRLWSEWADAQADLSLR